MTDRASTWPPLPTIYEINTACWLSDLSRRFCHDITLGNVPDYELQRLADGGFDGIWLMGVWQRSKLALTEALGNCDFEEFKQALPDFEPDDVVGSPYAIAGYTVDTMFGGEEELAALRQRLRALGLRLILDFIPNHFARDHEWLDEHPERLVRLPEESSKVPEGYFRAPSGAYFAHGKDPNLYPWTDTVQLDYRRRETRVAMMENLLSIADRCDGVRCDMAMLATKEIFLYTWGGTFEPPDLEFWPEAVKKVRSLHPDFLMLAEVYWDLETELQQMGFDYTYDKGLRDVLLRSLAVDVRIRLYKSVQIQRRLARFIENHDDERCREICNSKARSMAVAVVALTVPGLRLLHDGQLEGRCIRVLVQLRRRQQEPPDGELAAFYRRLLLAIRHPVFHEGEWRLLQPQRAWPMTSGHEHVISYQWMLEEEVRLVVANLCDAAVDCVIILEPPWTSRALWLSDLLSPETSGSTRFPAERAFSISLEGYGCHVFAVEKFVARKGG